jgi:SOS response regulatory protein OraA/RecX
MLKYELRKKSIDDEIIEKSMALAPSDIELGIKLGRKYIKRYSNLEDKIFKKKMTGVLARRMFPFAVINEVIIELLKIRSTKTD